MTASYTPKSVDTQGNFRVHWVPDAGDANPLSAADVQAGVDVTYYLKNFTYTTTTSTIEDPRLTLPVTLSKEGPASYAFELQYIFGDPDDDAAREAFPKGAKGTFVLRYAHANSEDFAAAQVVDTVPAEAGKPRKDTPGSNTPQFTVTQAFSIVGVPQDDVALIA